MAGNTAKLSASLSLNRAEWQRNLTAAKKDAGQFKQDLAAMKMGPFLPNPDMKRSVSSAKAATQQWAHLNKQAIDDVERHRRKMEGSGYGRRGQGGGLATSAYHVGQDLVQGGPSAIANQVPQIMELLRAIPPAAYALTAIAGAVGYSIMETRSILKQEEDAFNNYSRNRAASDRKAGVMRREKDIGKATTEGEVAAQFAVSMAKAAGETAERAERETAAASERRDIEREAARMKIEGLDDAKIRARALAEFDKRALSDRVNEEKKAAESRYNQAVKEEAIAAEAVLKSSSRLLQLPKSAALTPEEMKERASLKESLPGQREALKLIQARVGAAADDKRAAGFSEESLTARQNIINEQRDAALRDEAHRKTAIAVDKVFDAMSRGLKKLEEAAKWVDADRVKRTEVAKGKTDTLQDLRVGELRARGKNRMADKVEVDRRKDQLVTEGFTKDEASEIADREARARDGRLARRGKKTRGEVAPGGLDGFRTTNLDAGVRDGIPGFDERVTQRSKLKDREAAEGQAGKGQAAPQTESARIEQKLIEVVGKLEEVKNAINLNGQTPGQKGAPRN